MKQTYLLSLFTFVLGILNSLNAQVLKDVHSTKVRVDLSDAVVVDDRIYIKYAIDAGQSLDVGLDGSPEIVNWNNGDTEFIVEYDSSFAYVKTFHFLKDSIANNGELKITNWDVSPNGTLTASIHITGDVYLTDGGKPWESKSVGASPSIADAFFIHFPSGGILWHSKAERFTNPLVFYYIHDVLVTDTGLFLAETYMNSSGSVSPNLEVYPGTNVRIPVWNHNTGNDGVNTYIVFYPFGGTGAKWKWYPLTWSDVLLDIRANLTWVPDLVSLADDISGNIVVSMKTRSASYKIPLGTTSVGNPNGSVALGNVTAIVESHLPVGNVLDLKERVEYKATDYEGKVFVAENHNGSEKDAYRIRNGQIDVNSPIRISQYYFGGQRGYRGVIITNTAGNGPKSLLVGEGKGYYGMNGFGQVDSSYVYGATYGPRQDNFIQLSDRSMWVFEWQVNPDPTPRAGYPIWRGFDLLPGEEVYADTCSLDQDAPLTRNIQLGSYAVDGNSEGVLLKYTFDQPYPYSNNIKTVAKTCDSIEIVTGYRQSFPTQLCMVTVNDDGKNTLLWNWPFDTALVNMITGTEIYREKGAGNFEKVATLGTSEESIWIDTSAGINPMTTSYRYQYKHIIDYGSFSERLEMSPAHETMHLTANKGLNGEANLIWDAYEGIATPYYYIYRDTSLGFVLIDSVTSSNFTYSDFNTPNQHQARYRINALDGVECTASPRRGATYVGSFSNTVQVEFITSMNDVFEQAHSFSVYPNPSNGIFHVRWLYPKNELVVLKVNDMLGKTVHVENLQMSKGLNNFELNLAGMSKGVYMIQTQSHTGYVDFQKITIE